MAFTYSTIWSFTTSRSLEIDFIRRVVTLHVRTLFSETTRSEDFDQFKCITVCHADYRSTNYGIALEYKDGWIEYLGWSEFGAISLSKAMDLVNKIAPKMGIEINAPTFFEEKPLKKNREG
jgi:pyoverdine/dityrosine biosynthesis protein Dit1